MTPLPRPGRNAWLLLRKELVVGLRSASFWLLVAVPLGVSLLMRGILGGEGPKPPRIAVVGQPSPRIAVLCREIGKQGRRPLRIVQVKDEAEGRRQLERGKLGGLLVLPPTFDADLAAGRRPGATLYYDETSGSAAFGLRLTIRELLRSQAGQLEPARLEAKGIRGITPWQALLPAWVVMLLLSSITLMPQSIATERQSRTLAALLVTPLRLWEIILGKGLFGALIGVVGGLAILLANESLTGNLGLVLLVLGLGATVATLIGILIGLLVETPQNAAGVATALYIPLLWGAFFSDLGGAVGRISQLTPSHFMSEGLRQGLFAGASIASQWVGLVALSGLALALLAACTWALRREEERL